MQIDARLADIDDCLYRLAVKAFVINEGKVLLVREKDDDWWSFPGGGVDYGEDLQQALHRELSEELGVSTKEIQTDYQIVQITVGAIVNAIPRANLFYMVSVAAEKIRVTDDVLDFKWFAPADLINVYVSSGTGDLNTLVQMLEAQIAAAN